MGRTRLRRPEGPPPIWRTLAFWVGVLALGGWTEGGLFRPTEFQVSAAGLAIKGDPYGRTIPLAELQLDRASVVDLGQEPGYRPRLKLNGIGLPGYRSGWHKLEDHEKALVFLSRSRRVVHIPTTRGYALLLAADRPEELLAALRGPGPVPRVFSMTDDH